MSYKILIIDDEIAEVLALGLKGCDGADDLEFHTASDGGVGLTKAVQLKPALILLDIDLPVIDGFKILAELQRRCVRTRIIMISGSRTDLLTAIECVKAGACDYVVKQEIEANKLLQRIRRALILESTINVRVTDLPASSQALIREAGLLKEKYEEISEENRQLKSVNESLIRRSREGKSHFLLSTTHKVLSVILASSSLLVLNAVGVVQPIALPIVFVFLLVMLLIPADKIRGMSANVQKIFSANIELQQRGEDRSEFGSSGESKSLRGPANQKPS